MLVSSYRDRLPACDRIVAETIHSAWRVARNVDINTYNPPSRLRNYDVIFIDEASQIDDTITTVLFRAIAELPQKPLVVVCGDFSQLEPIAAGGNLYKFLHNEKVHQVAMEQHEFARSKDPILLDFLSIVRKKTTHTRAAVRFLSRSLSWSEVMHGC